MAQIAKNSARELAMARRRAMYESGKAGIQKMTGQTTTASRTGAATATAPRPTTATATTGARSPASSSRVASMARRDAMKTGGKKNLASTDRTRGDVENKSAPAATPAVPATQAATPAPATDKRDCGCGCNGDKSKRPAAQATRAAVAAASRPVKKAASMNPARAASLARRVAMSSKGKAAIKGKGPSEAQTARAANPGMSSRDLAQQIREIRSKSGKTNCGSKSKPCGRVRPGKEQNPAAAEDAPWKVGASETAQGQTVTGTMVGRSASVTGDEPSTCRGVTGTEYLGADIFRDFCGTDAPKTPSKVKVTATSHGNAVSGNKVGRSNKVTGDEAGTCKNVTGNEYVSAGQTEDFCGTATVKGASKFSISQTAKGKNVTGNNVGRSEKVTGDEHGSGRELTGTSVMQSGNGGRAPAKVGMSATLRGGNVTGTMIGRAGKVTGDEPGSCRNVTGDDYVGAEQYDGFCKSKPSAKDFKVGVSATLRGKPVTGTMTGRSETVTGDEPGTCKAVTGTPYAGAENFGNYCDSNSASMAAARTRSGRGTPGKPMTGLQPGIGGVMTGANKGACENLTGTPYVGTDQFAQACPSVPAEQGSPDFPQTGLNGASAPWGNFSVNAPNHASQSTNEHNAVTGTQYEKGTITGPFGMAGGKVTGTEEARFGHGNTMRPAMGMDVPMTMTDPQVGQDDLINGRVQPRISGEGQDAGLKITGDDWERNERVTGTEGRSATRRNPTRRGNMALPMAAQQAGVKRNEEIAEPVSKITGGSGNTERGSLITYSGGARG